MSLDGLLINGGHLPESGQSSQSGIWEKIGTLWTLLISCIQTSRALTFTVIGLFIIKLFLLEFPTLFNFSNSLLLGVIRICVQIIELLTIVLPVIHVKMSIGKTVNEKFNERFETHLKPIEARLVFDQRAIKQQLDILTSHIIDKDKDKDKDK